jgi:hypothetical protein
MATPLATAGRRRRLTLAPKLPMQLVASSSLLGTSSSGSQFLVLGSDSSGSEDDDDSIPVEVALQALNEETPEDGWTPVVRRRKKSKKEAVGDFWREIGFPTPLSRYWEKMQRSRSPAGTPPPLFCRSVDVYTASGGVVELDGSLVVGSPSAGSVCRGVVSSPSGLRIARSPRMGPWRGEIQLHKEEGPKGLSLTIGHHWSVGDSCRQFLRKPFPPLYRLVSKPIVLLKDAPYIFRYSLQAVSLFQT